MGDPCSEELSKRVNAARKRAVPEREQRLQKALGELEQIRAAKSDQEAKQEARASMTDADGDVYTCPAGKTMCCDRKPEGTSHRADRSRLPSVRGGLPGVLLQRSLLSEDVRQRAHDQPTRRGHSGGHLRGEDGDRPGQG